MLRFIDTTMALRFRSLASAYVYIYMHSILCSPYVSMCIHNFVCSPVLEVIYIYTILPVGKKKRV